MASISFFPDGVTRRSSNDPEPVATNTELSETEISPGLPVCTSVIAAAQILKDSPFHTVHAPGS
jgi:hypothetical protein